MKILHLSLLPLALFVSSPLVAQTWTQLKPTNVPGSRSAHVMANDFSRRRVVMCCGSGSAGETFEWDGKDWTKIAGTLPQLLYPTMSYSVAQNRTVLFGGRIGSTRQNTTYEWDGKTWTTITTANSPSTRYGACQAYDWGRRVTVMFSGLDGNPYSPETWEYDGKDWKLVASTGPKGRIYPAMCYDFRRQRCVMFAGYSLADLSDTWEWDGKTWKQIQTNTTPPQRWGHIMVYDFNRGTVVMYGGYTSSSSQYYDDTWTYDGSDWTQLSPATKPAGRRNFAGAYDNVNGKTLIYGGSIGPSETWSFDLGYPALYTPYGSGCTGTAGTPSLAAASGSLPWINSTFTAEVKNLPPTAPVAMFLGTSRTSWGPINLPFKLDALGATGCALLTGFEFATVVVSSGGTAKLSLPIPNDSNLLGAGWFQQALVIDPKANAFGASFSNGAAAVIGKK